MQPPRSPIPPPSPTRSTPPATCPTTGWRPRRTSPCAWAARCSSRATPGVGKTALAQALADDHRRASCVRLQCYEGIDASQALYDWDFPRQILHLRAAGDAGDTAALEASLYDRRFLVARPILQALEHSPSVLLIDEIDRADDEFEAFLLEVLADNAVTIPELGTITRRRPPLVVLTSNRTREVHDALKRRCLYHWVAHPDFEREVAIVRAPHARGRPSSWPARSPRAVGAAARGRPAQAARRRRDDRLGAGAARARRAAPRRRRPPSATLGAVLKYHEDIARVQRELDALLGADRR